MLTAMRSAVEAMAPALARVNAVIPCLIDTPLLHIAYGAERDMIMQNRAAMSPGRRVGTAEEVAQVILMLMTNAYLTGEGEIFHWPGVQARKSAHPKHGERYTIVRGDFGEFRVKPGGTVHIWALTRYGWQARGQAGYAEMLTIYPETAQRISTTALENGATLEGF